MDLKSDKLCSPCTCDCITEVSRQICVSLEALGLQLQSKLWLSVGGSYLATGAVCLCVLGLEPRAQWRHTH